MVKLELGSWGSWGSWGCVMCSIVDCCMELYALYRLIPSKGLSRIRPLPLVTPSPSFRLSLVLLENVKLHITQQQDPKPK